MKIIFNEDGTLTALYNERTVISRSPVGMIVSGEKLLAPKSLRLDEEELTLVFDTGAAVLSVTDCGKWYKLKVESVPEGTESFVFGPYTAEGAESFGELVGSAWFDDGSVICIQSLNPKTVGESRCRISENNSGFAAPAGSAAGKNKEGKITLQCSANDMSKPCVVENLFGMKNAEVEAVEGPDAYIPGAAIALLAAEDSAHMLEIISELEVAENLPHPTIDGEWAKTSPRSSEIYFVIPSGSPEEQVAIAERAGVHCLYFSDPFKSWGHFDINREIYPNGREEFRNFVQYARAHGVDTGFHTLSNFIKTDDPYVTPVPHKDLLTVDSTVLTKDLGEDDTVIYIKSEKNYGINSTLNCARIGDELICFKSFDKDGICLKDCTRGAFGTVRSAHKAGSEIKRMSDHGYKTLFPNLKLQAEVAENIGELIKYAGIRRISFDGIEGCQYPGRGEYGCSEFVRKVFETAGNELLCDASGGTHYRWHAHSYFNWGEPFYDDNQRGGMYNYRALNQDYFRRNLLPGLLGWYMLWGNHGKFEATTPEVMEFILSRTVAFDAGLCIYYDGCPNGRTGEYLDLIKNWIDFRAAGVVTEDVKKLMREEHSDWHLEKTEDEWILRKMSVYKHDLGYRENKLVTESGTAGYESSSGEKGEFVEHKCLIVLDKSSTDPKIPCVVEPLNMRIRVGYPDENGKIYGIAFYGGWFGSDRKLGYNITANAGDYIEFNGKKARHYDKNFNLIAEYEDESYELKFSGTWLTGYTIHYLTDKDAKLTVTATAVQTEREFRFPLKK